MRPRAPLFLIALLSCLAVVTLEGAPRAQQVRAPATASEVPGPAAGAALTKAYVQSVARFAYVWGWPLVSSHHRRAALANVPQPGVVGGVLPVSPPNRIAILSDSIQDDRKVVTCANQDVVYGAGYLALDNTPVVFQVPDFGHRFWVFALFDARTDEFSQIGRAYGTKPGFYLVVGPSWNGRPPPGITAVLRSPTELAFVAPRVFRDDTPEDLAAVRSLMNHVDFYPLSEFDGKWKVREWINAPRFPATASTTKGEPNGVVPELFFEQLPGVMNLVPPLPGEESLYRQIRTVLDAAAKDPAVKKLLKETAIAAEKELVLPLFRWKNNGLPAGNGWNSPTNSANFGTDYANRTAAARSNIYENRPSESKHFYTDDDSTGKPLRGSTLYSVTFPAGELPPVRGLWSLTLYDERHFFHENAQNRHSLGTKSRGLKSNPDGSLTLYAGQRSPGKDKESNWLPAPAGTFSLYLRAYWPDAAILDGRWKPPVVARVR
jgi:hypothetical protein